MTTANFVCGEKETIERFALRSLGIAHELLVRLVSLFDVAVVALEVLRLIFHPFSIGLVVIAFLINSLNTDCCDKPDAAQF